MDLGEMLKEKKVLFFDGALGTALASRGLDTSGAVNLTNPEAIAAIHREYATLGVDFITTNTFSLNRISAEAKGISFDWQEANRAAVSLALEAAGEALVAANIGPTGKLLQPYGTFTEEEFQENYAEQAALLAESGAAVLLIETMTDLREALCALQGAKATAKLPVLVTMSFARTTRGGRTVMGNSVADIASALETNGAAAVGANCGELTPREMMEIASLFRENTTLPVMIQPNAGKPRLENDQAVYDMPPEEFAAGVWEGVQQGVSIVGGCCGTTPAHLRALLEKKA